jgi:HSP20 family protein
MFEEVLAMSVTRYEPWGTLSELQREMNRVFNSMEGADSSGATAGWIPAVDIYEYADRFAIAVDLPGVEPAHVDIHLDNGVLTLSGERVAPATAGSERAQQRRIERGQGRFFRRFVLPDSVDAENVKATSANGVLAIDIPKQAKATPRRIAVGG